MVDAIKYIKEDSNIYYANVLERLNKANSFELTPIQWVLMTLDENEAAKRKAHFQVHGLYMK